MQFNINRKTVQQLMEMSTWKDNTATVTLTATELKPPTIDWSVEVVHKEFSVFKSLAKMWLETKVVTDHK